MSSDFLASRRVIEAKAIEEHDGALGLDGHIPFAERIASQPRERFRAPVFVAKTAPPELHRELDQILEELWRLNEEFVGERTRVAEVTACSEGGIRHIRDRLMQWSRSFFDIRLVKDNPKDLGDPCRKFFRLAEEFEEVFGCFKIEGTLNYVLFDYLQTFVLWRLYDRTYREDLERFILWDEITGLGSCPPRPILRGCLEAANEMGFLVDGLDALIREIRRTGRRDGLNGIERMGQEAVREELTWLASDIQEMRPFLVHNFNPAKSLLTVGEGLVVAWSWATRFGIANIIGEDCERQALEAIASNRCSLMVTVDYEGRLLEPNRPWSTGEFGYLDSSIGLVESLYVLRRFHEKLWGFYDQIDQDAIRREAKLRSAGGVSSEAVTDEVFALSCQDAAANQEALPEEPGRRNGRRIGMVQFKTLTSILKKWFDCDVRPGPGSEVVITRPGFKPFTLGHHVRNPEFPASTVRRLLARLGISEEEWLRCVYA